MLRDRSTSSQFPDLSLEKVCGCLPCIATPSSGRTCFPFWRRIRANRALHPSCSPSTLEFLPGASLDLQNIAKPNFQHVLPEFKRCDTVMWLHRWALRHLQVKHMKSIWSLATARHIRQRANVELAIRINGGRAGRMLTKAS